MKIDQLNGIKPEGGKGIFAVLEFEKKRKMFL
jgi:hypothetical protein